MYREYVTLAVSCHLHNFLCRQMEHVDLQALQQLVNELIGVCQQLAHENQVLRDEKTHLASECEALQEKNVLARTRIEAVIARLKAMEVNS